MIEVLKQALEALEDVGVLTDREWQAVHKNKANELRQAIAELESQEPDKYEMDIECTKCGAKQSGVLTVNTHPPQRTWQGLTDEEIRERWFAAEPTPDGRSASYNYARAIEAKLKELNT